jgi:DNA-binding IclR family transcriptional regulator
MPLEELSSCNIHSIAAATGLNRETVRRKVEQLVKRGLLTKERGAVRLAPGFTQQALACEVVKSQLDELRRAINDLIRAGAVTAEY